MEEIHEGAVVDDMIRNGSATRSRSQDTQETLQQQRNRSRRRQTCIPYRKYDGIRKKSKLQERGPIATRPRRRVQTMGKDALLKNFSGLCLDTIKGRTEQRDGSTTEPASNHSKAVCSTKKSILQSIADHRSSPIVSGGRCRLFLCHRGPQRGRSPALPVVT